MADYGRDLEIGKPPAGALGVYADELLEEGIKETKDAVKGELTSYRKRRPLHWFNTGTSTVFKVFNPGVAHKLLEIRFKTAALAAAEDFTITKTNTFGAVGERITYHDVILFFEELGDTGTTDLSMPFGADEGFMTMWDSLVFALSANVGSDRWGLEVIYELV